MTDKRIAQEREKDHELHDHRAGHPAAEPLGARRAGLQPEMFEKAAASNADVIFLDLEDAVAPDQKAEARENVVRR